MVCILSLIYRVGYILYVIYLFKVLSMKLFACGLERYGLNNPVFASPPIWRYRPTYKSVINNDGYMLVFICGPGRSRRGSFIVG